MKAREEFIIPYLGLSNGSHEYTFAVGNDFFSLFEKSKIEKAQFEIVVILDKQDSMVVLSLDGHGEYQADCDRCLAMIGVPLDFIDQMIIKFEEKPSTQLDEVYYLDPHESNLDLSQFINEAIHLHLPMKNVRDCVSEGYTHCDHQTLKNLDADEQIQKELTVGDNPWKELGKLNLE